MDKAYLVVEGHGEDDDARNLVTRLWADLGFEPLVWARPDGLGSLPVELSSRTAVQCQYYPQICRKPRSCSTPPFTPGRRVV